MCAAAAAQCRHPALNARTAQALTPHTKQHDPATVKIKFFMAYKGALMVSDAELLSGFERCRELGALPQVHAENGDAVAVGQARVFGAGVTGPEGHALSGPAVLPDDRGFAGVGSGRPTWASTHAHTTHHTHHAYKEDNDDCRSAEGYRRPTARKR